MLGALGAIGGVSTAAKNLVIDPIMESKKQSEEKRHNEALEASVRGSGVTNRTLADIANNIDSLSDEDKRQIIKVFSGMGYTFI